MTKKSESSSSQDAIINAQTGWLPPDQKPAHPIYVPLTHVDRWFNVSRDTVYRAAKRNEVRIYAGSGRSVVKFSEMSRWIESKTPHFRSRG